MTKVIRSLNGGKIRIDLNVGPLERITDNKRSRTVFQAIRCPHCNSLLASGDSYKQHLFFCERAFAGVKP